MGALHCIFLDNIFKAGCHLFDVIFVHLILFSYDYNMHVESLLSANVCLVILLSSQ